MQALSSMNMRRATGMSTSIVDRDRMRQQMKRRKITIGTLAQKTGLHYNTIYRILNTERSRVAADTVNRLADALQVSAAWLLNQTDNPLPPQPEAVAEPVQDLIARIQELSPRRQAELLEIVEALHRVEQSEMRQWLADLRDYRMLMDKIEQEDKQELLAAMEFLSSKPSGLSVEDVLRFFGGDASENEEQE